MTDVGYRYTLSRTVGGAACRPILWVMLNPSTADDTVDDPTIRRVVRFSKSWGYGRVTVINLFAARATDPRVLLRLPDPVGERNDDVTRIELLAHDFVLVAWGTAGKFMNRQAHFAHVARGKRLHCLGTNADGSPRHPLYVRGDTIPELWFRRIADGAS